MKTFQAVTPPQIMSAPVYLAILAMLAAAPLGACSSVMKTDTVTLHTALGGANVNPTTGVSLGYGQTSMHAVPTVSADGKTLLAAQDACGKTQQPATYATLSGTASASAAGSAAAGPQASVAIANVSATGEAARYLALGAPGVAPSAATIAATDDCSKASMAK